MSGFDLKRSTTAGTPTHSSQTVSKGGSTTLRGVAINGVAPFRGKPSAYGGNADQVNLTWHPANGAVRPMSTTMAADGTTTLAPSVTIVHDPAANTAMVGAFISGPNTAVLTPSEPVAAWHTSGEGRHGGRAATWPATAILTPQDPVAQWHATTTTAPTSTTIMPAISTRPAIMPTSTPILPAIAAVLAPVSATVWDAATTAATALRDESKVVPIVDSGAPLLLRDLFDAFKCSPDPTVKKVAAAFLRSASNLSPEIYAQLWAEKFFCPFFVGQEPNRQSHSILAFRREGCQEGEVKVSLKKLNIYAHGWPTNLTIQAFGNDVVPLPLSPLRKFLFEVFVYGRRPERVVRCPPAYGVVSYKGDADHDGWESCWETLRKHFDEHKIECDDWDVCKDHCRHVFEKDCAGVKCEWTSYVPLFFEDCKFECPRDKAHECGREVTKWHDDCGNDWVKFEGHCRTWFEENQVAHDEHSCRAFVKSCREYADNCRDPATASWQHLYRELGGCFKRCKVTCTPDQWQCIQTPLCDTYGKYRSFAGTLAKGDDEELTKGDGYGRNDRRDDRNDRRDDRNDRRDDRNDRRDDRNEPLRLCIWGDWVDGRIVLDPASLKDRDGRPYVANFPECENVVFSLKHEEFFETLAAATYTCPCNPCRCNPCLCKKVRRYSHDDRRNDVDYDGHDNKDSCDYGNRDDGPRRDYGGKKDIAPRRDRDDGPRRDYGGKKDIAPRRDDGPRRDYGNRDDGPRRDYGNRDDGPRRDRDDKEDSAHRRVDLEKDLAHIRSLAKRNGYSS